MSSLYFSLTEQFKSLHLIKQTGANSEWQCIWRHPRIKALLETTAFVHQKPLRAFKRKIPVAGPLMCRFGRERQGMQVMLASFKASRLPWDTDNKSFEFSASSWPLCSLVWSQTYGDWLRATSFKLAGQECWLSAHLPLSFCCFQGAPTISLSCWYLSGPRLFFYSSNQGSHRALQKAMSLSQMQTN